MDKIEQQQVNLPKQHSVQIEKSKPLDRVQLMYDRINKERAERERMRAEEIAAKKQQKHEEEMKKLEIEKAEKEERAAKLKLKAAKEYRKARSMPDVVTVNNGDRYTFIGKAR